MTATSPLIVTCPRCRRRVLAARWDHHENTLIGQPVIDPIALTTQQILACIITGTRLWQIYPHNGHTVTSHRTRWWPTHQNHPGGHTAPEHDCDTHWAAPTLNLAPDPVLTPADCPF